MLREGNKAERSPSFIASPEAELCAQDTNGASKNIDAIARARRLIFIRNFSLINQPGQYYL
jgi:hypothetical protein